MHATQILMLCLLITNSLHAEVKDKWKVNIGGLFVTELETEMQITPAGLPIGVKVNSDDQLNMDHDTAVWYFGGYYRFNDKHSISGSYYSIKNDGDTINEEDFVWNGKEVEAGSSVDSYFNVKVLKLSYLYSFYHNEEVELAFSAGVHVTDVELGLNAYGIVDGVPNSSARSSSDLTTPLPTFGFKGEYTLIKDELFVKYQADYLYIEYGDVEGSLTSSTISLEYRFLENFGIGIGYMLSTIVLEEDDRDKKVEVDNKVEGVQVFLSYTY